MVAAGRRFTVLVRMHQAPDSFSSLAELFLRRRQQSPNALAYAMVRDTLASSEEVSYGQLGEQVDALAAQLIACTHKGDRVLLVHAPGIDFVRAFWACVSTGRVAVPVPAPDAARFKHAAPRLQAIIADAQASAVMTSAEFEAPLRQLMAEPGTAGQAAIALLSADPAQPTVAAQPCEALVQARADCRADDIAYLQYTSGSTSAPRGAMLSHRNALQQCFAGQLAQGMSDQSRVLSWLPHHHDYGLVLGVLWPLFLGARSYLLSPLSFLRRPLRWLEAVGRFGITHSGGPNFAYRACVQALEHQASWDADLSGLQVLSCGAEPIQLATLDHFVQAFAPHGLNPRVMMPSFGMAEAVLGVSAVPVGVGHSAIHVDAVALAQHRVLPQDEGTPGARALINCGPAAANTEVIVVDPQSHQLCRADTVGELWVRGDSVGQGYWGQPKASAETFGARLADGQGPFLRTGDLGFMQGGDVFVTGRLKDLIIVRGRNVYPQDLEWTAQAVDPGLRQGHGAAFAIEHEGGEAVVLVQEFDKRQRDADLPALAAAIRRALALEHELPLHSLVLVRSGTLPRTSSGKIRRRSCQQMFRDGELQTLHRENFDAAPPAPRPSELSALLARLRAANATEAQQAVLRELLLTVVADTLGCEPQELALDRSGVENGLDSLSAVRALARLDGALGLALVPSTLLALPDLASGALAIWDAWRSAQSDGSPAGIDQAGPLTPERLALAGLDTAGFQRLAATLPGGSANVQDAYPLAPLQEGLLALRQLQQGDIYVARQLSDFADRAALDRALQGLRRLVARHPAWRTVFAWDGLPRPVQFVLREADLPVHEHAPIAGAGALARLASLSDPMRQPMDLSRAPLLRCDVLHDPAQDRWLLALSLHHLVIDQFSLDLVREELQAIAEGREAELPPAPGYRGFVQAARAADGSAQEAFFREQLAGLSAGTQAYGLARAEPDGMSAHHQRLPHALATRLRRAARAHGTSSATLAHTAWALVLARATQSTDLVFGTVLSGRWSTPASLSRAIGLFVNTLPLRLRLEGLSAAEALTHTQAALHGLLAYEHTPLAIAQRAAGLPAGEALFNATLNVRHVSEQAAPALGRVLSRWERTHYPIVLSLNDHGEDFSLDALCAEDLDPAALAGQFVQALQGLSTALLDAPETPALAIDTLPAEQREQQLRAWNASADSSLSREPVHRLVEAQASATPEAEAVRFGQRSLSYAELNAQANRLARELQAQGAGPGSLVALHLERALEMPVAYLAVLKSGAAFVPLDPELPTARLARMLADTGAPLVLTQSALQGPLQQAVQGTQPRWIALDAPPASLATRAADNLDLVIAPEALAYVLHTSGSTGTPKGVMVPQLALSNTLQWAARVTDLGAGQRMLHKSSIGFDASLLDLLPPLTVGATAVLALPGEHAQSDALVRTLREQRISHVFLVPSQLRVLLDEPALAECSELRYVLAGGEALDGELAQRLARRLPRVRLGNFYGPTEAAIVSTQHELARGEALHSRVPSVPIGRPIANTQCHVLDAGRRLLPAGAPGELFVGGMGLALGYLNRPDLTAERFVPSPFEPSERLYATGDLVRWLPDGQLQYLGRADEQVKIRGIRIELGEVEAVLNAQDWVREAAVVARADHRGQVQLVAYVAGQPGWQATALRAALQAALPEAMVPALYVPMERLPRQPSGKLDRKGLPAPDPQLRLKDSAGYQAPEGHIEHLLATLWQELLGLERVGRDDHFFDLGGHSLSATQLASRVRAQVQVELPLREVFDHPTLRTLAARIQHHTAHAPDAGSPASIQRAPRDRPLPVSFSQRRMWLVQQMTPETTAYNMPFGIRLLGALDAEHLERALDHVAQRHEAFRTRFELIGDEPMQVIDEHLPVQLQRMDLAHLPLADAEAEARRRIKAISQRPFDLSRHGLHHAHLLRLADNDHVMLWVMHHAIGDAWSAGVISSDLMQVYNALAEGREPDLPPLAIDYPDYAVWQRQAAHGEQVEAQLAYWRERLAGLSPLQLPVDRQRRGAANGRGGSAIATLDPRTLAALRRFSAAQSVTPYMVLLSCLSLLLGRVCGQEDVAVGTPIANRQRFEAEELVGTFVNTLVMRTDLSGNPAFGELLARVRDGALDAYAHQDTSFERLVEELAPGRDASSSPLVQVMFNVVNTPLEIPRLGKVQPQFFDFDRGASQFDLSVTVDTEVFGKVYFEYAEDLFEQGTVEQLLEVFVGLIRQVLAQPDQPIGSYSVLSAADATRLSTWNATEADYEREATVHSAIAAQAARTPSAPAVVHPGFGELSHGELDARANQLAHALRARGVQRGQLVGLCVERGLDMLVAQLAILKAGAAYVPLDPAYPSDRLAYMAEDAQLALLLSDSSLMQALPWPREKTLLLDIDVLSIASRPDQALAPDALRDARPEDPAYVIYTSGSTGKPKGVVVHHQAVVNFLASMAREPGLSSQDTVLALTTLSFDIAVLELLLPLTVGARIVLASRDDALDGSALAALIAQHGVTLVQATPSSWRMLIEAGWGRTPGLKALIGGEGLPLDLAEQLLARCDQLWNMYGPTETTVWSTCWRVQDPAAGIRIGTPIANTSVQILDERLQPCPIGVPGEICIGGEGVTLGYHQRAELTAERFVADPQRAGARLYRTGDRGRWRHDGTLEHHGRMDFQVKLRGHRIELGEIESLLMAYPSVARALLIVREDSPGDQRLVAYLVAQPGAGIEPAALREHLKASLPDYMLPQHFVALQAIPLLPNGKVNRHALPVPQAGLPTDARSDVVAPSSEAERSIAAVWARLLGLGPAQVSTTDNFFDLGGHSLLAMRAVNEIQQLTGEKVALRRLIFENLGQIAATVAPVSENAPTEETTAAEPAAPHHDTPPQGARPDADAPPPERRGLLGRLFGRRR